MSTSTSPRGIDYDYDAPYASDPSDRAAGWVSFAAIMLGFAGAWNVFDGILAIANSKVYTANATYVFSDLNTWGWIILVLGTLEVGASFALFAGSQVARWFGIAAASLNAIGQLMFMSAYPFWALSMFAVDLLIIYGLAVYGARKTMTA
jgi:hypothetical protein